MPTSNPYDGINTEIRQEQQSEDEAPFYPAAETVDQSSEETAT